MTALRLFVGLLYAASLLASSVRGFQLGTNNQHGLNVSLRRASPKLPGGGDFSFARPETCTMMITEAAEGSVTASGILQNSDVWVFLAGVFPFAWATVEFWRRIMMGESFGTGSDQVIIGIDDSPTDSRGRRVLGKGALVTAYILFALAFGTIGIVLYSVISSGSPPDILPEVSEGRP